MPSFFEELMDEIGAPQLYDKLGATVTRYPLGVIADAVSVVGIWTEEASTADRTDGESNARTGKLQVASSQTVDQQDFWLIDSVTWKAGTWRGVAGGMKEATLTHEDGNRRTGRNAGRKL